MGKVVIHPTTYGGVFFLARIFHAMREISGLERVVWDAWLVAVENCFSGHSEQSALQRRVRLWRKESPNRRFGSFLRSLDCARDDNHRRQRLFQQPRYSCLAQACLILENENGNSLGFRDKLYRPKGQAGLKAALTLSVPGLSHNFFLYVFPVAIMHGHAKFTAHECF